jgi:hypothetical protein
MTDTLTEKGKWFISLEMVILFFIIANPLTYRLVGGLASRLFGLDTADAKGCPTMLGVGVHAVVFGILVRLLMLVPRLSW